MRSPPQGKVRTVVDGHPLVLSHLEKPLWPSGFTKGEALHYYARIAEVMLPHLAGRPASFLRFPDGVDAQRFYIKAPPPGTPDWVRRVTVPGRSEPKTHVAVDDLATLMVMANLAALEIHVPQWHTADGADLHDRLVIDLDPGPGRTVLDCARVALLTRDALAADGLTAYPKTSGGKGLHLYAPLRPSPAEAVIAYAKRLAVRLEADHAELVVHTMAKERRAGRVFFDWSQNSTSKTTAAPYTLRAGPVPTVSAPVTWRELEDAGDPGDLVFAPEQAVGRAADHGDLLADLTEGVGAAAIHDRS